MDMCNWGHAGLLFGRLCRILNILPLEKSSFASPHGGKAIPRWPSCCCGSRT